MSTEVENALVYPIVEELCFSNSVSKLSPIMKGVETKMKVYKGSRNEHHELMVTVNGIPLNHRFDLFNHCREGFECGHGGVGAAQLALAMLADHLGNDRQAMTMCQSFKWEVISKLDRDHWCLTSHQIQKALRSIQVQM